MNTATLQNIANHWRLSLLSITFALMACGGGESSDGNNAGGLDNEDPALVDFPIVYIKRSPPVDEDGEPVVLNYLDLTTFKPGAELFIRQRASASAEEVNLTEGIFAEGELYDIQDLSVSYDGTTLLFSMRAPRVEGDEDDQPTWNIWEHDIASRTNRRIITSDFEAEAGNDLSPQYLPDGRIVFSTERQQRGKAILLDEGRPQFIAQTDNNSGDIFNIHVMNADGTDIQQLTFNQSHDFSPRVMRNGRIQFLRWDNLNRRNKVSLYSIRPDGSQLSLDYGFDSPTNANDSSASVLLPRILLPDGRLLAMLRSQETIDLASDMVAIDIDGFTDVDEPAPGKTSEFDAAQTTLAVLPVSSGDLITAHGTFASAYPLFDGTDRLLVAWSQCVLQNGAMTERLFCNDENINQANQPTPTPEPIPDNETDDERMAREARELARNSERVVSAPPVYGLWMYDVNNQTQQPILKAEEGVIYSEAVVVETRPEPEFISSQDLDVTLQEDLLAIMHIRSVYDVDGMDTAPGGIANTLNPAVTAPSNRTARFIRLSKNVALPDRDTLRFNGSAFGRSGSQRMRQILGYAPIEPDGSVMVAVPADVAITFDILNANGHRIGARHDNWLHFAAGETRHCNGCHINGGDNQMPHGRVDAQLPAANPGATADGTPFINNNPLYIAELGETMAETRARIEGLRQPTVNLVLNDDWTNPAVATPLDDVNLLYADLETAIPTSEACQTRWSADCRVEIHYPIHIQPIWEIERPVLDNMDVEIANNRCTSCHTSVDIDGMPQIPMAQLDLQNTPSNDNNLQNTAFRELLFRDFELELIDGILLDRTEIRETGEFETDEDGNLILDNNDMPIPILETIRFPINNVLRAGNARNSRAFFSLFEAGGSHENWLSAAERKLIGEWIDIGGQYYNNPFEVPQN